MLDAHDMCAIVWGVGARTVRIVEDGKMAYITTSISDSPVHLVEFDTVRNRIYSHFDGGMVAMGLDEAAAYRDQLSAAITKGARAAAIAKAMEADEVSA